MYPLARIITFAVLLLASFSALAQIQKPINTTLTLENGLDVPIQKFNARGTNLILWLPSEFGLRGPEQNTARDLQNLGVTTWIVDLHTAYFEPVGRSSLQNMAVKDIAEIIELATKQHKTVYVLSAGRGAALSLLGIRERQIVKGSLAGVAGAILLYPNFAEGAPMPGENPRFVPITSHSNLPIYIFQPAQAARYWQLNSLRKTLSKGGSPVYAQVLKNVRAGFDIHETHTSDETTTIKQLPKKIVSAIRILSAHKTESFKAVAANQMLKGLDAGHLSTGLQSFPQRNNIIPLHLPTLEGHWINLKDYKGTTIIKPLTETPFTRLI